MNRNSNARELQPTTRWPLPAPAPQPAAAPPADASKRPIWGLFLAYAFFIVYATSMPFEFTADPQVLEVKRQWINWDPTVLQITGEPTPVADVLANVLFFVPLGVLGVFLRRRPGVGRVIFECTLTGFLLSLAVEVLQFFTPTRNPATSDLICNTGGALLGAVAAALFRQRLQTRVNDRLTVLGHRQPLLLLLFGLAVLQVLRAVVPLDVSIAVNLLKRSVRASELGIDRSAWTTLGGWGSEWEMAWMHAVVAGLLFVILRVVWGRRGAAVWAVALSAGLGVALEAAQLVIRSRVTSTQDVVTAFLGSVAGVAVAVVLLQRGWLRHAPALALGGWAWMLLVRALTPFDFALDGSFVAKFEGASLLPYRPHYFKATLEAVHEFLDDLLLYLPFGFLLARALVQRGRGVRLRTATAAAALCAAWALLLEVLQLLLPARYVDVSDVVTAALAGLLGGFAAVWFEQLASSANQHHLDGFGPTLGSHPQHVDA